MVEFDYKINKIDKKACIINFYALIDSKENLYIVGFENEDDCYIPIINISSAIHISYKVGSTDTIEDFEKENHIEIVKMYGNHENFKLIFSER